MRSLAATMLFLLAFNSVCTANPILDNDEITKRISEMNLIVEANYNKAVELHVKKYLSGSGSLIRNILYRSAIYFPIFEKHLKEQGLPEDLKYLAVVESALNPRAMSPVGAGGLWQFMAGTGRNYGLVISKEVDERSCTHKSTEAAIVYLRKQYERYGSWELALAAYNCGAGNVDRAIQRAKSDNYWKLHRYLPRETNNFVPAFIAVAYVANYYHLHDIEPSFPHLDLQLTEPVKVFTRIDFKTIAAVTGIPLHLVAEMNQAFRKNYVPERTEGFNVLLPRRVATSLREYLDMLRPDVGRKEGMPALPPLVDSASYHPESFYVRTVYKVIEGDNLAKLAELFSCSTYHLKVWNNLVSSAIRPDQELTVWFSTETRHFLPQPGLLEAAGTLASVDRARLRQGRLSAVPSRIEHLPVAINIAGKDGDASFAALLAEKSAGLLTDGQQHRDFEEVAAQFEGMTIHDLLKWNGLAKSTMAAPSIKVGMAGNDATPAQPLEPKVPAKLNIDGLIEWDDLSRLAKPNPSMKTLRRRR